MILNGPIKRKKPVETVTLTLTGNGYSGQQHVEIDGMIYIGGEVINVEVGSVANCYLDGARAFDLKVIVNGVTVASEDASSGVSTYLDYSYVVTKNATIAFSANPAAASITITEETE